MNKDKLVIFDTTMRDGEQSPGASMTLEEKVRIGKALERMRVDVIEAGFAIASPLRGQPRVLIFRAMSSSADLDENQFYDNTDKYSQYPEQFQHGLSFAVTADQSTVS